MQIKMSRMLSAGLFTAAVAGAATIGYVKGASAQQPPDWGSQQPYWEAGPLLTGEDIGFKLRSKGSTTGVLMIRVDGQWVPAQFPKDPKDQPGIRPLAK